MALFRPNSTPEEIASWAEKEFEKAHGARLTIERQWLLNLAFNNGKHWVTWGPAVNHARRLEEPKNMPPWRVRLTVNKVQPYIRREMARLSSSKPRGMVLPASPEESDRHAARSALSILDYLHEELELDDVHDLADWWVCNTGSVFYKVRFTEEPDQSTGEPGRLRVDVIRPFDIYVSDIEETRIKEQEWVCQAQALRQSEIAERWGVDVRADGYTSETDAKVRSVMSVFNQDKGDDFAVVKEFWIKRCPRYPNGLVLAICNGKLLPYEQKEEEAVGQLLEGEPVAEDDPLLAALGLGNYQSKLNAEGKAGKELADLELPKKRRTADLPSGTIEWPFGHGRLPFIPRGHTKSGRFYDSSFVEQIIPLQREYNRSRSQIVENKNLTSRPQWAVPLGAVDRAHLTTEPGAVIPYAPGFNPPEPIKPPQLPNYVIDHIRLTAEEMDELASQNDVSKGDVPPNVEAATAIAYLQEKDDAAVGYAVRSKERAIQEIGQQLLGLVQEYWDEPRLIRVVGQNEVFDAYTFKGAQLRGNTDYRVVSGSGLPRSRAAQEAKIMQLMEAGIIPAPKGLRMMDMPDISALIQEVEIDLIEADKENLTMARGQYADVYVWQDHVAHLDEHDAFKKREEYKHLDDVSKSIFEFHDYQHLQQLVALFNMLPPEPPEVLQQRQAVTAQAQQVGNPYYVDPVHAFMLRTIFIQLKAGAVPQPSPAQLPPASGNEPPGTTP